MVRAPVLVVDDEPAFLRMVTMAIRLLGYEPISAPDAEAALEMLKTARPSLVLTDIRLPGMDGLALAKAIQANEALAKTPVLLMSAFGCPGQHTAAGFLGKPFHVDELSLIIDQYMPRNGRH